MPKWNEKQFVGDPFVKANRRFWEGKEVVITGVSGQDGSYLADLMVEMGAKVTGIIRPSTTRHEIENLAPVINDIHLYHTDLTGGGSGLTTLIAAKPYAVFNLAAQSHVKKSFDDPIGTTATNYTSVIAILELIRNLSKDTKFYQASTSEMFGGVDGPADENTPFHPNSPYAIAKTAAHWAVRAYRTGYGIYACSGILHNHESPRRGEEFVTQKIIKAACAIKKGEMDNLSLGNLSATRDWGHAKDYVKAMVLMMQQYEPDDYIIGMGKSYSVLEFLLKVFSILGLDHEEYVSIDENLFRPNEVHDLIANASKAKKELGWHPEYTLDTLIQEMIERWR